MRMLRLATNVVGGDTNVEITPRLRKEVAEIRSKHAARRRMLNLRDGEHIRFCVPVGIEDEIKWNG